MGNDIYFHKNFTGGFIVAMTGIVLISFNGQNLELNPLGDLLAIIAALVWAFYSILTKKISNFGYPVILSTRRTFFYGILFMIPALFLADFQSDISRFGNITYLFNILYLGLGASALCFVTWNFAVKELGAVKTSVYIYMVPVITVITSVLILHEIYKEDAVNDTSDPVMQKSQQVYAGLTYGREDLTVSSQDGSSSRGFYA